MQGRHCHLGTIGSAPQTVSPHFGSQILESNKNATSFNLFFSFSKQKTMNISNRLVNGGDLNSKFSGWRPSWGWKLSKNHPPIAAISWFNCHNCHTSQPSSNFFHWFVLKSRISPNNMIERISIDQLYSVNYTRL